MKTGYFLLPFNKDLNNAAALTYSRWTACGSSRCVLIKNYDASTCLWKHWGNNVACLVFVPSVWHTVVFEYMTVACICNCLRLLSVPGYCHSSSMVCLFKDTFFFILGPPHSNFGWWNLKNKTYIGKSYIWTR